MSVGADSTITPIFAGGLRGGRRRGLAPLRRRPRRCSPLMVGAMLIVGGVLRLGWVADLLSIPVTTGFLAGIAGHIVLSPGARRCSEFAAPRGHVCRQGRRARRRDLAPPTC